MNRNTAALLLVPVMLAGAVLGYLAGPHLARTNYTVRLAARIWHEDRNAAADRTLESEAFRLTGGADRDALYDRAHGIVRQFRIGGLLFGLWCGLVVGLKTLVLTSPTKRTEFEVDQAWCVSCGRCYRWCPREQLRLNPAAGEPSGETLA